MGIILGRESKQSEWGRRKEVWDRDHAWCGMGIMLGRESKKSESGRRKKV